MSFNLTMKNGNPSFLVLKKNQESYTIFKISSTMFTPRRYNDILYVRGLHNQYIYIYWSREWRLWVAFVSDVRSVSGVVGVVSSVSGVVSEREWRCKRERGDETAQPFSSGSDNALASTRPQPLLGRWSGRAARSASYIIKWGFGCIYLQRNIQYCLNLPCSNLTGFTVNQMFVSITILLLYDSNMFYVQVLQCINVHLNYCPITCIPESCLWMPCIST